MRSAFAIVQNEATASERTVFGIPFRDPALDNQFATGLTFGHAVAATVDVATGGHGAKEVEVWNGVAWVEAANDATEDGTSGNYVYEFTTDETNHAGRIGVRLSKTSYATSYYWVTIIPSAAGINANVISWLGTAVPAPTVAGIPRVEVAAFVADAISAAAVSAAAATKIARETWSTVLEGSHTAGDMVRGIMSNVSAKVSGFLTGILRFRDLADTKDRWTVTTNADGRVSVVPNDLTEPGAP